MYLESLSTFISVESRYKRRKMVGCLLFNGQVELDTRACCFFSQFLEIVPKSKRCFGGWHLLWRYMRGHIFHLTWSRKVPGDWILSMRSWDGYGSGTHCHTSLSSDLSQMRCYISSLIHHDGHVWNPIRSLIGPDSIYIAQSQLSVKTKTN